MSDDLKPCPFCGSEASIFPSCDHSTAWVGGCSASNGCPGQDAVWEDSEEEAYAVWNTRADLAKPRVKPLVWDKNPDEQEWYAKIAEVNGDTFERGYMILPSASGFTLYDGFASRRRVLAHFTLAPEAKAAAQADYERRILSAMEGWE